MPGEVLLAEKVLVTGGAGYVGSASVERLLALGHRVAIYDNLSMGHRQAVPASAVLEVGDLADPRRLGEVFKSFRPDVVMHFAALALAGESYERPTIYYRNNVANGVNLLEAMIEAGVKSMIFSSSCAVYGEPGRVPITEDQPKLPVNPYGKTKLAFENLLEDCENAYGLKSVCLRYFNAAGATALLGEDHEPETHIIPNILGVALGRAGEIEVFGGDYPTGDGTCVRDYVHIEDLAQAHEQALGLLRQGRSDRVNLGNGDGFSVMQVIKVAEKVSGKRIPFKMAPRRKGDPAILVASSTRARSLLGWRPVHDSLEDIVESAWRWHREHPYGYGGR
jgi:UDP-glucose 4-epimerase